jgi:hypothetical protein
MEPFCQTSVPVGGEKAIKDSIRRCKLHEQSEAAAKALHKQQAAIAKGMGSGVTTSG